MNETTQAWYRSLDESMRSEIRQLHEIRPLWNLAGVLFIVLWIVTVALMNRAPSWWLRVPGYVFIGVLIHGMANLMHEATHGNLFRRRWLNRWFGFVMGAPALLSVTSYRVNHLLHHRHTRGEDDPDEFGNLTDSRTVGKVFFYFWIAFGMAFYLVHVAVGSLKHGRPEERRAILFEVGLLFAAYVSVIACCWARGYTVELIHFWIIPLLVAAILGNVRGWAEHQLTKRGHVLTETRTVTSSKIYSFFNVNLNYHLEHHLFPGMPWYNLPKLHRLLIPQYRTVGASIYSSYLRFLLDAIRAGPYGLAPP